MVKTIEKHGMPIVHMINLIPVASTVGSNRMVETVSIPYPFGGPELSEEEQYAGRYEKVGRGLRALTIPIDEQTVFAK